MTFLVGSYGVPLVSYNFPSFFFLGLSFSSFFDMLVAVPLSLFSERLFVILFSKVLRVESLFSMPVKNIYRTILNNNANYK